MSLAAGPARDKDLSPVRGLGYWMETRLPFVCFPAAELMPCLLLRAFTSVFLDWALGPVILFTNRMSRKEARAMDRRYQ